MAGTNRFRVLALVLASLLALLVVVSGALFSAGTQPARAQTSPTPQPRFAPGEVLIKFEPGTTGQQRAAAHRQNDAEVKEIIPDIGARVVKVPVGREQSAVATYERNPNVSYAELNTIFRVAAGEGFPNDPLVGEQWQYDKIDSFQAWQVTEGNSAVDIAVLDTGIDQEHVDLRDKIAKNSDFTGSGTFDDENGHGTHVAGSAAAVTDNGTGVAGTCPDCSLYNVKILGADGKGKLSWVVKGVTWAADNGAEVINMSFGQTTRDPRNFRSLRDAVNYAWEDRGAVLVAAAGNTGASKRVYPACYSRVIAVASTDQNDAKAPSSAYGDWVDVAAPGVSILSTLSGSGYGSSSGTSMAAPHVAGEAGLVWDTLYGTTNKSVRARIMGTAEPIAGTGTLWVHGRINANDAVAPPPVG